MKAVTIQPLVAVGIRRTDVQIASGASRTTRERFGTSASSPTSWSGT